MSDTRKRLGARIAALRKRKGLRQMAVAEAVGLEPKSLSRLEAGAYAPSLQTLEQLARVLGVELRDFFNFPDAETPEEMREYLLQVVQAASAEQLAVLVRAVRAVVETPAR